MNITKENLRTILIEVQDTTNDIKYLLEKLEVLADDLYANLISRINLKTERGRLTAEYDLNIANIKTEMMCEYLNLAIPICEKMINLTKHSLEYTNTESSTMVKSSENQQ